MNSMESETKKKKKEGKSRGRCNSIAKGMLPKRESEKALRKLAEQNAKRGYELEISKKMINRRDQEIQALKESLKCSDKTSVDLKKKAEKLDRECDLLEREYYRFKKERDQLKHYSKALETQIQELKNDYFNH
jgi:hypothetical protein